VRNLAVGHSEAVLYTPGSDNKKLCCLPACLTKMSRNVEGLAGQQQQKLRRLLSRP
jgi:hypothetical protein